MPAISISDCAPVPIAGAIGCMAAVSAARGLAALARDGSRAVCPQARRGAASGRIARSLSPMTSGSSSRCLVAVADRRHPCRRRSLVHQPVDARDVLAELNNTGVSHFYLARTDVGPRSSDSARSGACWTSSTSTTSAVLPAHRRCAHRDGSARCGCSRTAPQLGANRATLEVRRSNEAAQKLYESSGSASRACAACYYSSPPEDALVLWREGLV